MYDSGSGRKPYPSYSYLKIERKIKIKQILFQKFIMEGLLVLDKSTRCLVDTLTKQTNNGKKS